MTTHRLLLLRHAKAEHPENVADHDRPLSLVGRRQSSRVGAALAAAGLVPDLVLCSSSLRTRQTWEIAKSTLGAEPPVELSEDVYSAGTRALVDLVRDVPESVQTLLVVGHEPTMSHVAEVLAGPDSDVTALARVRVGVPTGSWTLLETDGSWDALRRGEATLVRLAVPE